MSWRARTPRADEALEVVHDGDTLWLETDRGDWLRKVLDVRLRGVRAPELSQPGGVECRGFVIDWLDRWGDGRWPFWVDSYRTTSYRDVKSLERFVCDVWNRDRSRCLNFEVQSFIDAQGFPPGN